MKAMNRRKLITASAVLAVVGLAATAIFVAHMSL